jgi:hypothetical protein
MGGLSFKGLNNRYFNYREVDFYKFLDFFPACIVKPQIEVFIVFFIPNGKD